MTEKKILLSLSLLLAFPAAAEELALPAELPIDPDAVSTVSLVLDRAVLKIKIDPEAAPGLTAKPFRNAAKPSTERDSSASFEVVLQGRTLHLSRRAPGPESRRVEIELSVRPEQILEIVGDGVEIEIDAPLVPAIVDVAGDSESEGPAAQPSRADLARRFEGLTWRYRLRLRSSSATLVGLPGATVEAFGSDLEMRGTRGPLALELEGGSVLSEDHRGEVQLAAKGTKVSIHRQEGGVLFNTEDGELTTLTGSGPTYGEATGGIVSLLDWAGRAVLHGEETQLEIRDGHPGAAVEIAGRALTASVARLPGALSAELEGGSLVGSRISGKTAIIARRQASVSLEGLVADEAELELTEGASGLLVDVDAVFEAQITDARLEVDGVLQIGVKAVSSELVAQGIESLRMISLKNSVFDIDFSGIKRQPALALRGTSEGRLRLAQPCVVRLAGELELVEEHAEVSGCQLVTLASPKADRMRGQRGYPEGTTVLVTNLEKGTRLEVEGVVVP